MTTEAKLTVEKRQPGGKGDARKVRRTGKIPGVVYGREMEPIHVAADYGQVESLFSAISVENTVVDLEVPGDGEKLRTLVREVQTHPYRSEILHIDFLTVQAGVAVELEVPLELLGTPKGVKDEGGVLEQSLNELPIRCIPSLIPESIEVDVSELDIGDSLSVEDLTVAEGIEIMEEPERTICSVQAPSMAEAPEPAEEEEAEVEVVGEEEAEAEEPSEGEADSGGDEDSE